MQATDQWIGVRNARIVLVDDSGVRARMAGAWLRQMGHRDVFVVEGGLDAITTGRERLAVPELAAKTPMIDVTGLVALLDSGDGTVVIDLARSIDFREGHIPGAHLGRAHAARCAEAATCPDEARGDHLAGRCRCAAGGRGGDGAVQGATYGCWKAAPTHGTHSVDR